MSRFGDAEHRPRGVIGAESRALEVARPPEKTAFQLTEKVLFGDAGRSPRRAFDLLLIA
jgi:hypothetical protein